MLNQYFLQNSCPVLFHQCDHEMKIMHRGERIGRQLFRLEQMMQIGEREVLTGPTGAIPFDRSQSGWHVSPRSALIPPSAVKRRPWRAARVG